MRRFSLYIALASIVLWPLTLAAQDVKPVSKPVYKSIEVKHFTIADGVQLSPNFSKYFYSSFLAEMQRLNVAKQTIEEGTPVNDTKDSHGMLRYFKGKFKIVLEGMFVSVQEGREKDGKFEAGSANIEIHFFLRKNHKEVAKLKTKVALNESLQNDEQKVAESAGGEAADAVRNFFYPGRDDSNEIGTDVLLMQATNIVKTKPANREFYFCAT